MTNETEQAAGDEEPKMWCEGCNKQKALSEPHEPGCWVEAEREARALRQPPPKTGTPWLLIVILVAVVAAGIAYVQGYI